MPLQRTGTPWQRQASLHRGFVLVNAFGKRLELGQVARFSLAQPGIQVVPGLLADHLHEGLCQAVSGLGSGTGLSDQGQFLALGLIQLLWLAHKQPGGSLRREVL
jgi:hypothetical protein